MNLSTLNNLIDLINPVQLYSIRSVSRGKIFQLHATHTLLLSLTANAANISARLLYGKTKHLFLTLNQ